MGELFPRDAIWELRKRGFVSLCIVVLGTTRHVFGDKLTNFWYFAANFCFDIHPIFTGDLIHVQFSEERLQRLSAELGKILEGGTRGFFSKSENRSKGNDQVDLILEVVLIFAESVEDLARSLGVAKVSNFAHAGLFQDTIDLGGDVVLAQLLEVIGEELFLLSVWINLGVLSRKLISSIVTEPYIITKSGKDEGWSRLFRIGNPCISGVEKTVLHEDDRRSFWEIWLFDSHHGQHVMILSFDLKLLIDKASILDDLFDRLIVVWRVSTVF